MLKVKMKIGLVAFLAIAAASPALAASKSIKLTKHNLSNWSPYAMYVKGNTTQVCVFCHAPHNADSAETPLWNHKDTSQSFGIATTQWITPSNSELTGKVDSQPTTTSKKCLSCHDGTVAIGAVVNRGNSGLTDELGGDAANGTRADVNGLLIGPNKIGLNLSGGHVISFKYDTAMKDYLNGKSEYALAPFQALNAEDTKSMLDKRGYMQCHTCHDPHTDACNDTNRTIGKDPLWRKSCDSTDNGVLCRLCHDGTYKYYTSPDIGF